MGDIRVKINDAGARQILCSSGVSKMIASKSDAIRDAANARASDDGMTNRPYESGVGVYGDRVRGSVVTANPHGIRNNLKYQTLLGSIYAGR